MKKAAEMADDLAEMLVVSRADQKVEKWDWLVEKKVDKRVVE